MKPRGFAAMSPELQRRLAAKGGRAAHAAGTAHEFTRDEARMAGRKGFAGGLGRLTSEQRSAIVRSRHISASKKFAMYQKSRRTKAIMRQAEATAAVVLGLVKPRMPRELLPP